MPLNAAVLKLAFSVHAEPGKLLVPDTVQSPVLDAAGAQLLSHPASAE